MLGLPLSVALAVLAGRGLACDKAVFARYLVGNAPAPEFGFYDWKADIDAANKSGLDGFALNVAAGVPQAEAALELAFKAALDVPGFSVFLSFDYVSNGSWAKQDVISLMQKWASHPSYYHYDGKPLVSSFEGSDLAGDWVDIKNAVPNVFIPNWSSLAPKDALAKGTADGLLSWFAWPDGTSSMTTQKDDEFMAALGDKPYMMPVAPWYYTNLPDYGKNWLWGSDDLWYTRWNQVHAKQPALVQVLTWNDYGESDYVGPLPPLAEETLRYGMFKHGRAPFNYAENMPHDGWRRFLPYVVQMYKKGSADAAASAPGLQVWYRLNPGNACSHNGTTGNTASQGQTEVDPSLLRQDRVYFSALLDAPPAAMSVTIGGTKVTAQLDGMPPRGTRGLFFGSAPFSSGMARTEGQVVVSVTRADGAVMTIIGQNITCACENNIVNWNAWTAAI